MHEAFFFGPGNQRVFANYHPAAGGGGAVLTVICPPLFSDYRFARTGTYEARRGEIRIQACTGPASVGAIKHRYKVPFQRLAGLAEPSACIVGSVFASVFSLHSSWSLPR